MADGIVQVAPDSSGKKVDTSELTVGANTVERQRIVIADDAVAAAIAVIANANPAGTEYGLITRPIPSGTQAVSGTFWQATQPVSIAATVNVATGLSQSLTDTQLRASAVPVSGTFFQTTQPVSIAATVAVQGAKTDNNAAPGATNEGVLAGLANASVQSKTEGNQIILSTDLNAALRVVERPPVILGSYQFAGQTAGYTGLSAGAILIMFRWTDATKICAITRINVRVNTTTAATGAGMIDRDVVIVRGFTAGDTGGTTITLTGNNNKLRTSQATTVVGTIMLLSSGALTAGTGTADANAIGLMGKQGSATEPVGLTLGPEDLFVYNVGKNYPIILAQNEGFRVRIPTAMPASIVNRTLINVEWMELAAAGSF